MASGRITGAALLLAGALLGWGFGHGPIIIGRQTVQTRTIVNLIPVCSIAPRPAQGERTA